MVKTARTKRLLQRATQFAALKAKGYTNTDAYCLVTPGADQLTPDSRYSRASEFANHPLVTARVAEVLHHASVTAMDSAPRAHARLGSFVDKALEAGNMTAVAALERLRLSVAALLRENIAISDERGTSDKDLIDRVAKSDPAALPALLAVLGKGGFAAPQPSQTDNLSQMQQGDKPLTH